MGGDDDGVGQCVILTYIVSRLENMDTGRHRAYSTEVIFIPIFTQIYRYGGGGWGGGRSHN